MLQGRAYVKELRISRFTNAAASVIQRAARGKLGRLLIVKMTAQRRWDRAYSKIQKMLEADTLDRCPLGLKRRFCWRRTVWGGQIIYLNRAQRNQMVRSFNKYVRQIRLAFMRYMMPANGEFSGEAAIKALLSEGEMPYTLEQIGPIIEHARHSNTERAVHVSERLEWSARKVEGELPARVWAAVHWPAWRAPLQKHMGGSMIHLISSAMYQTNRLSAPGRCERRNSLGGASFADYGRGLVLTWSGFVDILFAMSRLWSLEGTWGPMTDKFGRQESMVTEFSGKNAIESPAANLDSFLEKHFSDDSKIGKINAKFEIPPAATSNMAEAMNYIEPYVAPIRQLMEFYDPRDDLTPAGLGKMLLEAKMPQWVPLVLQIALETPGGSVCKENFLAGTSTDLMAFGMDHEEVMRVLAKTVTTKLFQSKKKMSVKLFTKNFIKDLFQQSVHNMELQGTVIKGLD